MAQLELTECSCFHSSEVPCVKQNMQVLVLHGCCNSKDIPVWRSHVHWELNVNKYTLKRGADVSAHRKRSTTRKQRCVDDVVTENAE